MLIERLAIIGVGLIGGSLARALRQAGACRTVVGYGRHASNLEKAVQLGVIDSFEGNVARAVADADVVVLATPLATLEELCKAMMPALKTTAVVTDVGSAKASVVTAARRTLGMHLPHFVPGHPIAGTEKTGVEASFAGLFQDHLVILTPLEETAPQATACVRAMWEATGAQVTTMAVAHHDQVLAATSHLPHMLAYALVDCLAQMQEREEIFEFAAGGFADFTRIASSDPEMWHDICFSNREDLLRALERFDRHLAGIRRAIASGDSHGLKETFARAKKARDEFDCKRRTQPPRHASE